MPSSRSCPRCQKLLPDHTPGGVCPSCGSAVGPGVETPRGQETPASRDGDFSVGAADPNRTAPHLTATLRQETPAKRPAFVVPSIRNHTDVEFLGQGGMGVVFRAIQRPTDRPVAVKVMLRFTSDTLAHDRFLNEIRAQAKLSHPGIVPVYEAGDCSLGPYFTMELVQGRTLSQRMREGPVEPTEAARLIADAADAVHAAHEQGIIHRDIKPSNILLDRDGRVKVTDFGLAKHVGGEPVTERGVVVGTPSYMSPEQADADPEKVTEAADVYGLGSTLFHLVTGHAPHQRATPHATLRQKAIDPTPQPRAVAPGLCPTLEAIILRSMALDPAARFPTAAALASDLRKWAAGEETETKPLTRGQRVRRFVRRRRVALGLAPLAVALVAAAAVAGREADPKRRVERALARGERVTLVGETGLPTWHDWKLNPQVLAESELHDATWGFGTKAVSLCALVDDPRCDAFRLTAEVRHLRGGGDNKNPPRPAAGKVGLFWGYERCELPGGATAHNYLTFEINDLPDGANLPRRLGPYFQSVIEIPGRLPARNEIEFATTAKFRPSDRLTGEWRALEVEVSPAGFVAHWIIAGERTLVGRWTAADVGQQLGPYRDGANRIHPTAGDRLTGWRPRAPLGIVSRYSTLAVRNVALEPLSPPAPE